VRERVRVYSCVCVCTRTHLVVCFICVSVREYMDFVWRAKRESVRAHAKEKAFLSLTVCRTTMTNRIPSLCRCLSKIALLNIGLNLRKETCKQRTHMGELPLVDSLK